MKEHSPEFYELTTKVRSILSECTNPSEFILKLHLNSIPEYNKKDIDDVMSNLVFDLKYSISELKSKINILSDDNKLLEHEINAMVTESNDLFESMFLNTSEEIKDFREDALLYKRQFEDKIKENNKIIEQCVNNINGIKNCIPLILNFKNNLAKDSNESFAAD